VPDEPPVPVDPPVLPPVPFTPPVPGLPPVGSSVPPVPSEPGVAFFDWLLLQPVIARPRTRIETARPRITVILLEQRCGAIERDVGRPVRADEPTLVHEVGSRTAILSRKPAPPGENEDGGVKRGYVGLDLRRSKLPHGRREVSNSIMMAKIAVLAMFMVGACGGSTAVVAGGDGGAEAGPHPDAANSSLPDAGTDGPLDARTGDVETKCERLGRCCDVYSTTPELSQSCVTTAMEGDEVRCGGYFMEMNPVFQRCLDGSLRGTCQRLPACCARLSSMDDRMACESTARGKDEAQCFRVQESCDRDGGM
jgi:hypothetical protein